jgi:hypothetical protein
MSRTKHILSDEAATEMLLKYVGAKWRECIVPFIYEEITPFTSNDLAEHLGITCQSATYVCHALMRLDLLTQYKHNKLRKPFYLFAELEDCDKTDFEIMT